MKKKYYKQIIEDLEQKLENQVSQNKIIYKRMVKAEEENKMLRNDLFELAVDLIDKP